MMRILSIVVMLLLTISVDVKFITQNFHTKTIMIADDAENLQLQIDYSRGCKISQVNIKGNNTISTSGYTGIKIGNNVYTSLESKALTRIKVKRNKLEMGNM